MQSRKRNGAPDWAYYKHPFSKFGMIYADMLKSKPYRELSCSARQFLTVCIAHSSTEIAKECLYNALDERYRSIGKPKEKIDLNAEVYNNDKMLFIFPKKHYEEYGYTKQYVQKCFKELNEKGFIKTVQIGNVHRVSIYQFSAEWKK